MDANGDVFVVGKFQGTVDFGGGNRMSAGDSDIFVVKLNGETGAHIWSARYGGLGNDGSGSAIAVSGANEIVVAGTFSSASLTFGGATGNHLGSIRLGGTGQENGMDVTVAPDGRLYGAGHFEGFAEFGGIGHNAVGGVDGFIVGLNPLAN